MWVLGFGYIVWPSSTTSTWGRGVSVRFVFYGRGCIYVDCEAIVVMQVFISVGVGDLMSLIPLFRWGLETL